MIDIYATPVKVSGHTLFLSERPPTSKKDPEYNRESLEEFLGLLRENNIKIVVVLLTQRAIDKKYDGRLIKVYEDAGFEVLHYPIRDFEVPEDLMGFHRTVTKISNALKTGNVLMHCGAGLGRTGMVAAGIAIYKGFTPHGAMSIIRKVRPGSIETPEQEDFLKEYYTYVQMKEELFSVFKF